MVVCCTPYSTLACAEVSGNESSSAHHFLKENQTKNFGWPISSYGKPYSGQELKFKENGWMQTSHKKNGFIEPIKYFTPSIAILIEKFFSSLGDMILDFKDLVY